MNRFLKFFKNNWIILLILLVGFFLRVYKPLELFMYTHDQDLAGWIVKDVLINHHFRLIGQQTSSLGIFIGPVIYYLQIPFYLIANMDPVGPLALAVILGVFTVFSFYYVFSKVFNKRVGLLSALIYALSVVIIFTDREMNPTMPVMLWTVWYFYSLWKILKGNQKFYILIGFLFGLIWDLNLALAILSPFVVLVQIFSKKKLEFKSMLLGVLIFGILMTPFAIFEGRHGFQQTRSIISSFTTQKDYIPGTGRGFAKLDRVLQLVHTNVTKIYWNNTVNIGSGTTFYLLVILFIFLIYKKVISKELGLIMFLWQVFYILFFTFNSINASEYYLNGMNVIWIIILCLGINYFIEERRFKYLGFGIITLFILLNIWSFFTRAVNRSGYVERKSIVAYIDQDAKAHNYPCVSVSYITAVGSELGYRYLFWLRNMRVEQPKSGAPVYTIVYPLKLVDKVDIKFGVLGLILPDYGRYTDKQLEISCSGGNSNLTDPMFGYTQ